ncbi:hypothetical protein O4J55_26105, partial [Paracoccus sp. PXZ]
TPDGKYILFVQDTKGDENWHLHRVDVDGTTADLTPFPGVRVISLELSTDRPGKAFVQMNYRSPEFIDLYEIDIDTGALNTVAENPGRYVGWIIVPGGKLHTLIINERGDYELARYEHGWFTAVATFKGHDYPLGPMPIRATPDGKAILIGSNTGTDRTRLARIDLATGTETEIDSHPSYSLDTPRPEADPRYPSSLIVNPVTGQLLGARYLGERQVIHPLDPNFASVLERLRVLSDNDLGHISCDAIGRRWVVEFTDDRHPGTTWFYDHATGESRLLGERHPDMVPDRFARVRPVTVKSRDDLDIP